MAKTMAILKDGKLALTNVMVSFPNVFKPTSFEEGQTKKYSAVFMIPKDSDAIGVVQGVVDDLKKENKVTKALPNDNIFFVDGDETDREEYAGHYIVKAKNVKRPTVVNRDKSPLTEEDGLIYGGCIVNAVLDPYYYKHASGKQFILASLKALQYVEEGTPFGDAPTSADVFDDLDDL